MPRQHKLKNKIYSKAFTLCSPDDSEGIEVHTRDGKALAEPGALLALAESGDREAVRDFFYEYLSQWGVL